MCRWTWCWLGYLHPRGDLMVWSLHMLHCPVKQLKVGYLMLIPCSPSIVVPMFLVRHKSGDWLPPIVSGASFTTPYLRDSMNSYFSLTDGNSILLHLMSYWRIPECWATAVPKCTVWWTEHVLVRRYHYGVRRFPLLAARETLGWPSNLWFRQWRWELTGFSYKIY